MPAGIQSAGPGAGEHPIVAEVYPLPYRSREGGWRVLFDGSYKLHWNDKGDHRLYDLTEDPAEEQNLYPAARQRVQAMEATLLRYFEQLPRPAPPDGESIELDPVTQQALRQLGYIE